MITIEQLSHMIQQHLGVKGSCKWTVAESPLGGRGLVAAVDISPGEILFVDHPLVFGPRSGANVERGCTVCGKLYSNTFFKCSQCALLLCSDDCQNTNLHKEDCNIISHWHKKVRVDEIDHTLLSRALAAIRTLLLNKEQRQFITYLKAHVLPQHGSEIKDLKQYFYIPEEEENLMTLASCVLDTNAYLISHPYGKNEINMRGLFPVSSLLNSSCVPNTRYAYRSRSEMTVIASKPISAGTELFACYTGVLWGTPARRMHLYKTKHFLCICDRCADPTERGTYLAAVKCFSGECPGVLLPIDPLNTSSTWRCLECDLLVPNKNVSTIQNALGSMMANLDFSNVEQIESFLEKRVTKFTPKTNQVVVDLQCRLIWQLGETEGLYWHGR